MATDAEQDRKRLKYLAVLKRPIFLIVVNFFLVNTLFSLLPVRAGNIAYNAGRISVILYAGWLIVKKQAGGVRQAAVAGVFLYFIDHVLIKGTLFILNHVWKPEGLGLAAFSGVLISFVMFLPLALCLGALGGLLARSVQERSSADSE